MNIFKEIFTLIKMLFTKIGDRKELTMYYMKHFPFKNYKLMMWCGYIIYKNKQNAWMTDTDKNHETIHLYQARDKGSWFKYYISYLWQWFKGIISFCGWKCSYYTSKYEVEAFAKENDLKYLERREKNDVNKFKLASRRKTFKAFTYAYMFRDYLKKKYENI